MVTMVMMKKMEKMEKMGNMSRNRPRQGFAGILSKKDGTSFNAQGRHNGMTNVGRNNHCLCGSGGKWESIKIREG